MSDQEDFATRLFHVSSRNKVGAYNTTNGDFSVTNENPDKKATRLVIQHLTVPHCFPNVHEYINSITVGVTPYTLTTAHYTMAELAAYFNTTVFPATDPNLTLTVVTGVGWDDKFRLQSSAGGTTIDASIEFWHVLGFCENLTEVKTDVYRLTLPAAPGVVLADVPPNLAGPDLVYVDLAELTHGNLTVAGTHYSHNVLCAVPLADTEYGAVARLDPGDIHTEHKDYEPPVDINILNVRVLDEYMRVRTIPCNKHVTIVFRQFLPWLKRKRGMF